ncbi:MAG: sugar porter family MFS transporter [Gammaproteobacteria bacterium]|nr:sugar porter family MFS transporter [Gammaproteobacteria bacterium]MDH5176169.1 sugar porter family MFS transporter [Gammaproteobacteria bacterium]MDH5228094.1 sugar porter family MFS transporter [Gammaproteobacteria bacterium]
MQDTTAYTVRTALIVALGGFLMGFDVSVISGVVPFIETEMQLSKLQLGWAVASLTLTATLAMMISGPLSDRYGRLPVLKLAALLFAVSAIASAIAPDFTTLVIARLVGGLGVGAALIVAPMYIAEFAPARLRGRMVSFNQLNIVIGISAAFFSNYFILSLAGSDQAWVDVLGLERWNWRWMLGIEAVPAILYLIALYTVPESPRWLAMRGRDANALEVLVLAVGRNEAEGELRTVKQALATHEEQASLAELFRPTMRRVLILGILVAVLQQITGINAVFFYAPSIFQQSGVGTDAAFMQGIFVGLINLVFTVLAIGLIDRLGRRPLLIAGLAGIAASMLLLAYGFGAATYSLGADDVANLGQKIEASALAPLAGQTFDSDTAFRAAAIDAMGPAAFKIHESELLTAAISIQPMLILVGILAFVASFAMSLGPVMWVLFAELFSNRMRGIAISFVGLINSAVSFGVQLIFPWELQTLGNSLTFLIYAGFALAGLPLIIKLLPETKGKTLEALEAELAGAARTVK